MAGADENPQQVHAAAWLALGTVIRLQVVTQETQRVVDEAMEDALAAIQSVEAACSRFDADSELVRLMKQPAGQAVPVSPILFQSLQFALEVAKLTEGRFDPVVGARMEALGFTRHYVTQETLAWDEEASPESSYRDIELNAHNQTVCLKRALHLDLGAVAKGLAVDLASKQLAAYGFAGFVVDAGGDVYVSGRDLGEAPWKVHIRHPDNRLDSLATLSVTDAAVCTSGDYERRSPFNGELHHIVNAQSSGPTSIRSLTVIAPFTMMADAFSTAAFTYPPMEAVQLLEQAGLTGLVVTEGLDILRTAGMEDYLHEPIQ